MVLAVQSGCCCKTPWPCGDTYYGTQCGCKYWHWWFSHKPCCHDPCDWCGNFTCSDNPYVVTGPPYTRYGPVYSDGSGSNEPGAIGEMYPTPAGPSNPPSGVMQDVGPESQQPAPLAEPPMEELPGPSTRAPQQGWPMTVQRGGPVDSAPRSRTLGSRPRARLFSR
ncbi:MAG: hypothetical protein DWQ37_15420 [Planctomycetota bacterium]|nr:MAG: hypothetical protein DWQ37_15420 [Planctomycetota bacterium]